MTDEPSQHTSDRGAFLAKVFQMYNSQDDVANWEILKDIQNTIKVASNLLHLSDSISEVSPGASIKQNRRFELKCNGNERVHT